MKDFDPIQELETLAGIDEEGKSLLIPSSCEVNALWIRELILRLTQVNLSVAERRRILEEVRELQHLELLCLDPRHEELHQETIQENYRKAEESS